MLETINRVKYKIYSFDIESHADKWSQEHKTTSMWLGSFIDENSKQNDPNSYVYNMEDFFDKIEVLTNQKVYKDGKRVRNNEKNICVYVFNLSFEWSFIIWELMKRNFQFKENITKDDEFCYNSCSTKSASSIWSAQIKFSKSNGVILFKDLKKIFSGSLRKVAESFGLKTQKGDIDYEIDRRSSDYKVSDEERGYCFKDTKIVMEILEEMDRRKDKDFWNSASAASYSCRKMIKMGYNSLKPMADFRKDYPVLEEDEYNFLRNSVAGGICYASPLWQFKECKDVCHYDMHSAHPTSAYLNYFPYGFGEYGKGDPGFVPGTISCVHIKVSYDFVKLHSIIQLIGIDYGENIEITVWDFEIPTMKKCYMNLKIEYIDFYRYKSKKLTFRDYYKKCYEKRKIAKENKDDFNIGYYKLLINSSYGKLLEKEKNYIVKNCIVDDMIGSEIIDKDPDKCKLGAKYTYLPVGSAIPARTRVRLVETALLFGWKQVCYFDTDSIFIVKDENTDRIWNTQVNQNDELGGWSFEEKSIRAQFDAPKRYKLEKEDKKGNIVADIKCGGINFDKAFSFEEVDLIDHEYHIKRCYRCHGGSIITTQIKKVSVQEKYKDIFERNYEVENNDSKGQLSL